MFWKDSGQHDQEWKHFKAELKYEMSHEGEIDLEVYVFSNIIMAFDFYSNYWEVVHIF